MYIIEIDLSGLPASTNVLRTRHFRKNAAEANKWKLQVLSAIPSHKRPTEPLTHVKIELRRHSSVPIDYDNMVASFKPILDSIVSCGIITNDGPSVINHDTYICRWVKGAKGEGHITIKIEQTA